MTSTPALGGFASDPDALRGVEIARLADRDLGKAKEMAARAKADGVRSAVVHQLVAMDLKDAGRFEEAIAELGLGLQLEPRHAGMMTAVGFCLLELGRRQEAANVLGVAVKLDSGSVAAAYGYGCAAERLGALESAESAFKRVLEIDSGHANALAGLAGLAVRRRDWETARGLAERAVSIDARQTDARTNLARIDLGLGDFAPAEQRLKDIIALPYLAPGARADAWLLLGDALDGAGRFSDAFDAYAEGKSELRQLHAPEFGRPETKTATDGARQILSEFLASPPEAWTNSRRPADRGEERGHAFLLGFARSGTTLLEQVLATHPDIVALGERPLMLEAEAEFLTRSGGVERLAGVVSDLLEPYRTSYWARVRDFGVDPRGKVFVDKHPLSTLRLPLIHKVFPATKIIFVTRDPRDVALSCFRRSFNVNAASYEFDTIERAARYYDAVMEAGETYLARMPLDAHRVRYEDVVADFDATCRALCDFLEIPWTDELRNFAAASHARAIATPSGVQVGRGLYEEGVGHWRNYGFALEPAMEILSPWVDRYGYPSD